MEKEKIELLINKFFEGETSNEEEKELYIFFKRSDIPEYLKKYKTVFNYFENGISEELKPKHTFRLKKWIWFSGAVAATIILLIISVFVLNPGKKEFNPYEGSYIVRNGIKITDPELIKVEIEADIEKAEQIERLMEEELYTIEEVEKDFEIIERDIFLYNLKLIAEFNKIESRTDPE